MSEDEERRTVMVNVCKPFAPPLPGAPPAIPRS
jgi:hypothetical protein